MGPTQKVCTSPLPCPPNPRSHSPPMSIRIPIRIVEWMGLLQWASMLLFAPAAVVSEEVVGLQATTFLGALAGSTALLASSFGPSVNFLFFTYCFLAGAAYAFIYMPSLIILGHYFDSMLGLVAGFVQVGDLECWVYCASHRLEALVKCARITR